MKPNTILVVSDALRAKNIPFYGYEKDNTPFLSSLDELVVVEDFYSTVDQTDPSFTTIMTGKYPLSHGITRHGPDIKDTHLKIFRKRKNLLLSEVLNLHGVRTYAVDWLGRWHKRGFQVYVSPDGETITTTNLLKKVINKLSMQVLREIPTSMQAYNILYKTFRKIGFCYYKNGKCAIEKAKQLMDHHLRQIGRGKPFFLLIHLWDTHTPYDDLPYFLVKKYHNGQCGELISEMAKRIENSKWRKLTLEYHLRGMKCVGEVEPHYDAAVAFVDWVIRELYEYLKEHHLLDETNIVITGDHGENLIKDGIYRGHGGLFQRVVKVPLFMLGPSFNDWSGKFRIVAQHVDLAPTILSTYGIPENALKRPDGENLIRYFETHESPRNYVFLQSSTSKNRFGLIKDNYKLVYSPTLEDALDKFGGIWMKDVRELYDLRKDNDDDNNIYREHNDMAMSMISQLRKLTKSLMKKHMF